ncbi:DUF2207 domain-containing protein, partial [Streptomyces sp. A7024]|nr:DUF2207 domain-containing protein [Streptomyces coryli]
MGLVALLGAVVGGPGERIDRMWIGAEIRAGGEARITEVIDYDFAGEERHGVFRNVLDTGAGKARDISVTADGRTVPHLATDAGDATRIRIGDPARTVSGTHRYRITYTLPGFVDGREIGWRAVDGAWDVPIARADVHVTAPFALKHPVCNGDGDGTCTVERPAPGRLAASVGKLDAGDGMRLYADRGAAAGEAVDLPPAPEGAAARVEKGDSALLGWLWATAVALAAAAAVSELLRLAGRDRVKCPDGRTRRMDIRRQDAEIKPSPVPPAGLTPTRAGVLHAGRVKDEHRVAWLLSAARDGHLSIEGRKKPDLQRTPADEGGADADPLTAEVLAALFARKDRVHLGQFQRDFAHAWKLLRDRLDEWRRAGGDGLWLPAGESRRRLALWGGVIVAPLAAIAVGFAASQVTDPGAAWLTPTAVTAALSGAGLAAALRAWELPARTALGSQRWRETEAFRQYLAEPGDEDAPDAFTPWAVALGQAKPWAAALKRAASRQGADGTPRPPEDVRRYRSIKRLTAAALATAVPSSGGGGGGSSSSYNSSHVGGSSSGGG